MVLLHFLAATILSGATAILIVSAVADPDISNDRLVLLGGVMGICWAVVIFSGFLQIGSQYSPATNVLYKIGSTTLGGFIGISGVFGRAKGFLNNFSFVFVEVVSLFAFCLSFYWALS